MLQYIQFVFKEKRVLKELKKYSLAKFGCYTSNVAMSVVGNLSPLLFVAFKEMYDISYTLLGLLVVINFSTQLLIDLIFSFAPQWFNISKIIKAMPLITVLGLLIFAIMPMLFPQSAYLFISIGTVVFSVSAGLNEVLASPIIAAIPSENTDKEVSKLHSIYAWGVVLVVLLSALFIYLFGTKNWAYLALFWTIVPLASFFMFAKAELPPVTVAKAQKGKKIFSKGLWLCFVCIFLGGASEVTMAQWMSCFVESTMGIPKLYGDVLGVAMFAALLGLGRTLYAKKGKNVLKVMQAGMICTAACYLIAGLCLNQYVGLIACVLTGFCVSMLWPGTIIYIGENYMQVGVAAYALMAAGGDMGASVGPQLVGVISDKLENSLLITEFAQNLLVEPEQLVLRAGIIFSAIFPIVGMFILYKIKKIKNT